MTSNIDSVSCRSYPGRISNSLSESQHQHHHQHHHHHHHNHAHSHHQHSHGHSQSQNVVSSVVQHRNHFTTTTTNNNNVTFSIDGAQNATITSGSKQPKMATFVSTNSAATTSTTTTTSSSSSYGGAGTLGSGQGANTTTTHSSNSSNNNNVITAVFNSATSSNGGGVQSSSNSKKHSIGYHLRRWFRNTTGSVAGKHRNSSNKDIESGGDNQNFMRHTASLYSTSSGESEHHSKVNTKRKSGHRSSGPYVHRGQHHAQSHNNNNNNHHHHHHTQENGDFSSLFGTKKSKMSDYPGAMSHHHQRASSTIDLAGRESYECPICLLEQSVGQFPELLTCHHRVCLTCLKQYLRIEICESRIVLTCIQCVELLHPNDIQTILSSEPKLLEKYETFMVRRYLITEPDARWCPAPDCNYCVIATGCASCPKIQCGRKECETLFCYHCKQHWHAHQTCDEARQARGQSRSLYGTGTSGGSSGKSPAFGRSGSRSGGTGSGRRTSNISTSDGLFSAEDMKPCPCCKVLIVKMEDGSCNHMTCSVCSTEFCWLCMQKISDLHYLSPSGCTFWGKKPWSRKKKIMWQLGMLAGAPVGIALIAGIAVPAIIIGIPVWVGRKLHARFDRNLVSRTKSNLLVTAGVVTSVFVSPILAAVAVGIGVPILLAYVYGVVPISLCRSGGCGVSTSSSGVKFDIDDDEMSTNGAQDGFSIDTAVSGHGRRIANPSIGEMSLGLSPSLSIGSSTHLDRLTTVGDGQVDRESASIQACAGSIASAGTLQQTMPLMHQSSFWAAVSAASSIPQPLSAHHSTQRSECGSMNNKRFSFSSANADTLSFGERHSLNTNLSSVDGDAASIKVQTGSLGGEVLTTSNLIQAQTSTGSMSPIEVHVNIEDISSTEQPLMPSSTHESQTAPKHLAQSSLGKFESRSLEYLSANFCKLCLHSHRPCCPNFQHKLKRNIDEARNATPAKAQLQPEATANGQTSEQLNSPKSSQESNANICKTPVESLESQVQPEVDRKDGNGIKFDCNNNSNSNSSNSNSNNKCDLHHQQHQQPEVCPLTATGAFDSKPEVGDCHNRQSRRRRQFTGSFDSAFPMTTNTSNDRRVLNCGHHPSSSSASIDCRGCFIDASSAVAAVSEDDTANNNDVAGCSISAVDAAGCSDFPSHSHPQSSSSSLSRSSPSSSFSSISSHNPIHFSSCH